MSVQACRDALLNIARVSGGNASLLLASYLQAQKTEGDANQADEHLALLKAAIQASHNAKPFYENAYRRRTAYLAKLCNPVCAEFKVKGRLIVGLGGENVLETGITLQHTYGTPVIPGSALKGLAAHYCDQVWGLENPEFKRKVAVDKDKQVREVFRQGTYHHILFGNNEDCGHITFHDAWLVPDSLDKKNEGLVLDVMTPHHGDYSMAEDETPPADFDDPTPLPFLAVAGTFQLVISTDDDSENGKQWVVRAMELLSAALENWGVGGKTNAGYGRMKPVEEPTPAILEQIVAKIKQENHIPDEKINDVWRGQPLARWWKELPEENEKSTIKSAIIKVWIKNGWWTSPQGGAKKAKAIYEGTTL